MFASRLLIKPTPGNSTPDNIQHRTDDIQRRVDDISKQFPGAGWKDLPQELVDKILGRLLGDLRSLKACSLTCKCLFGATRPLIHQHLVIDSRLYHKPKLWHFGRRKKGPGPFERLVDADRSGVLPYTQHLIFKAKFPYSSANFDPSDLQEHLPRIRSITKLHTLALRSFPVYQFYPVVGEYFGAFFSTLRHLDMRNNPATVQQLLYFICQFPLLEDLTIVVPHQEYINHPFPMITQSPPLRGKLVLVRPAWLGLIEGLAALPGGLNFHSVEFFQCAAWRHPSLGLYPDLSVILVACSSTLTSVSYLLRMGSWECELNPSIHVHITM